jgi:hypothetical protein
MRVPVPARLLLATLACLAVAACGGSGDDTGSAAPSTSAAAAVLKASAGTQWGAQVTALDGAIDGFQATVAGIDGDSLLGDLPAIVGDLERIDTASTALEGQIDQACG